MLKVIKEEDQPKPWYEHGLKFKCTECGKCCTGAPGYIWLTEEEMIQIANHLNLSLDDFCKKYIRQVKGRFSLLERPVTYDCIFLEGKSCKIYAHRPTQCRTFPWWPQNLKSIEDWNEAAKFCEGIRKEAPVVAYDTIREQLTIQESTLK